MNQVEKFIKESEPLLKKIMEEEGYGFKGDGKYECGNY